MRWFSLAIADFDFLAHIQNNFQQENNDWQCNSDSIGHKQLKKLLKTISRFFKEYFLLVYYELDFGLFPYYKDRYCFIWLNPGLRQNILLLLGLLQRQDPDSQDAAGVCLAASHNQ